MRYMNLEGQAKGVYILVDIVIIMTVFMKNLNTKCL